MALSYNFFPTGDTIIYAALRRIRAFDPEDSTTVSTTQLSNARETLNFLLTHWQALGLPIWCRKVSGPTTLVAAQSSYTVGSSANIAINRPLAVVQAWLRDNTDSSNPVDIPIQIISQQEYYLLSSKSAAGRPTQLYFDATYDGSSNQGTTATDSIYLWPVPDSTVATTYTLYFIYQRPLLDFNASGDALDMPQEWYEAIRLNLALKIAPEYGLQASDYDRLNREAQDALELALEWDTEQVSVYFAPDTSKIEWTK